jgi:hypothetical protein
MLTRSIESDVWRTRDTATVVVVALLATVIGAFAVNTLVPLFERWRFGLQLYLPGAGPMFGTYAFTAWIIGGLVPGFITAMLLTGRFAAGRLVRVMAACSGVACLGAMTLIIIAAIRFGDAILPLHLATLALGAAAALFLVVRRRVHAPPAGRGRALIVGAIACGGLAIGAPTLRETFDEYRPQEVGTFTIELASAYPIAEGHPPTLVIDQQGRAGDIVEYRGARYTVHRGDSLRFTSAHVARVRWLDGGISFRFDREIAAALARRSESRISEHDALFIDGELVAIPVYETTVSDRLWLRDRDPSDLQRLYVRLTTR